MSLKTDQIKEEEDFNFNPILIDLLLKIPGINSKNIKRLINKCSNLIELCELSEEKLSEILENSKSAKLVYDFINKTKKEEIDILEKEIDFEDINDFHYTDAELIKYEIDNNDIKLENKSNKKLLSDSIKTVPTNSTTTSLIIKKTLNTKKNKKS